MPETRGFVLVDANVLVDYQAADLTILSLVSKHVLRLAGLGCLPAGAALEAAERIRDENPFVTDAILDAFRAKLDAIGE